MTLTFKTAMKLPLSAALAAMIITAIAAPAKAIDLTPISERPYNIAMFDDAPNALPATSRTADMSALPTEATIGLVRLDGGRMITLPANEEAAWDALTVRSTHKLTPIKAATYLNVTPEIPMDGQDTDNKIDEIRLAAADSGLSYVLIYGIFDDAYFASFGGKHLRETGLSIAKGSPAWQGGDAKVLLIETYSGTVIDAAVTWRPDMAALTQAVEGMLSNQSTA